MDTSWHYFCRLQQILLRARTVVINFLQSVTCYDMMPTSVKIVVFDTQLGVRWEWGPAGTKKNRERGNEKIASRLMGCPGPIFPTRMA